MATEKRRRSRPAARTSWDRYAAWYDGWVGQGGSRYHQSIAIPTVLELLEPRPSEQILDIGAGQGVLAPYISETGADYTGVDASPRLISMARRRHASDAVRFRVADATRLEGTQGLDAAAFDAAVLLLSIQDMDPLEDVLGSLDWALKPSSRVVLLMTHPAFRQPRHSGWGYDDSRALTYRRVDSYLTRMAVPMKSSGGAPATRSFHRPMADYINGLAHFGFAVDALREPADVLRSDRAGRARSRALAEAEIPLFLGLRARRTAQSRASTSLSAGSSSGRRNS